MQPAKPPVDLLAERFLALSVTNFLTWLLAGLLVAGLAISIRRVVALAPLPLVGCAALGLKAVRLFTVTSL